MLMGTHSLLGAKSLNLVFALLQALDYVRWHLGASP